MFNHPPLPLCLAYLPLLIEQSKSIVYHKKLLAVEFQLKCTRFYFSLSLFFPSYGACGLHACLVISLLRLIITLHRPEKIRQYGILIYQILCNYIKGFVVFLTWQIALRFPKTEKRNLMLTGKKHSLQWQQVNLLQETVPSYKYQ